MSSLGSPNPFFIAGKKAYEIERSLRFNDNDSAYLNFTPSGAGSNQMTFSFWFKRANFTDGVIFSSGQTNARGHIQFDSNKLAIMPFNSTGANAICRTDMLFRDPSAWYHVVISLNNTTYSNMSSTVNFYVNGNAVTFTTSQANVPSGGIRLNNDQPKNIGQYRPTDGNFFDGYLTEFNFIDGQVLDQSYFGETDPVTGQWNPKKYTGGYGSNGFYLNFSDNSGTTATTLGKDSSGNGNNFTPNNFSVSAGSGNDSLEDTPTNNFCTLNVLTKNMGLNSNGTLSNGNLEWIGTQDNDNIAATMAVKSGKWYYEATIVTSNQLVVGWTTVEETTNYTENALIYYNSAGIRYNNKTVVWDSVVTNPFSFTTNDVIGFALDLTAYELKVYKNGTLGSTITLPTDKGDTWIPCCGDGSDTDGAVIFNFGQRAFAHTPPTGHKTLCSANLPEPTIKLPNQHFNTLIYTGNDSADRDITGVGFQPDWLWIKNRSQADWNMLQDSVRGANKNLYTNDTDNEQTDNANGHVNSFLADGFNVTAGASGNVNENNENYVGWNWNAGDTDGKTYTVTVVSDSGNKYRFDGFGTSAVTLDLAEGGTYIFNYPAAHPFRFSTTADGTHGGGSEYTTGVTVLSSTSIQIVVAASAPNLNYYCSSHSGMGGAINTNSTLGSSNFDGSVKSTVKANVTAGFSIVTYSGTGSSFTFGHGLGVAPKVVSVKSRTSGDHWRFYFTGITDNDNKYLGWNSNIAVTTGGTAKWNGAPTSTVFGSSGDNSTGGSSKNYIAYCFSEVEGYSKAGVYTGNANTNGTFVFCGFRPAWVLLKKTSGTDNWTIFDNKRDIDNPMHRRLRVNLGDAEVTTLSSSQDQIDFLSNGFKMRSTSNNHNGNGATNIFLAFAESPFKNARAR